MEYLETIDDLARLKIPEIIEIELQIIKKVRVIKWITFCNLKTLVIFKINEKNVYYF